MAEKTEEQQSWTEVVEQFEKVRGDITQLSGETDEAFRALDGRMDALAERLDTLQDAVRLMYEALRTAGLPMPDRPDVPREGTDEEPR